MDGIRFDWTISAGTILQLAGMFASVIGLYHGLKGRIEKVEITHIAEAAAIRDIKDDLSEIRKEIIGSLEHRVRDLEITQASILTSSRLSGPLRRGET